MKKNMMRRLVGALVVVMAVAVVIIGIYSSGIVTPQATETIFIDLRGKESTEKWIVAQGDVVAQKIVIPTGVVYLRRGGVGGVAKLKMGCSGSVLAGISATLTTNENNWLTRRSGSIVGGAIDWISFEIDYDVSSGQTYYLMMKAMTPGECGAFYLLTTGNSNYPSGSSYLSVSGGSFQQKNSDLKFWLQGVIDLGATFEVLSAGAYPDRITPGQSTRFIAIIRSATGGTCNVILYKNYNTKEVWETKAMSFSQGEQKTVEFTKTATMAGTYPMAVECNIGGHEEAHRCFNLYVEQQANNAPYTPSLTGIATLKTGQQGSWQAASTDQEGDTIRYVWTVDGETKRMSNYHASGVSDSFSYAFTSEGIHSVSVKAEDSKGFSSNWATKTIQVSSATQPPPNQYNIQISVVNSKTYESINGAKVQNGVTLFTDSQGVAKTVLGPGVYSFTVTKDGFEAEYVSIDVQSSDVFRTVYLIPVSMPPSNGDEEEGQPGLYVMTVVVNDKDTGATVQDAVVMVGSDIKYTDSSGIVTFSRGMGTYDIAVSKAGYATEEQTVTITDSDKPVFVSLSATDGKDGEKKTPGFETVLLVSSVGIAYLLMRRRKKQ